MGLARVQPVLGTRGGAQQCMAAVTFLAAEKIRQTGTGRNKPIASVSGALSAPRTYLLRFFLAVYTELSRPKGSI